jgi:hypothetical protein
MMSAPNASAGPLGGFGAATDKVPPEWNPSWSRQYPFKTWLQDIMMWSASSTLDITQQGPAVVLRLSGGAREMTRTIDVQVAAGGQAVDLNDGNGPVHLSGLAVILRGLSKNFSPLDYETSVVAISDLLAYSKLQGETVDAALSRFYTLRQKVAVEGHALPPVFEAYLVLRGLHIQPLMWVNFLQPFEGRLPATEPQVNEMMSYIRRQGHLLERGSALTEAAGASSGGHSSFWMDPSAPDHLTYGAWPEEPQASSCGGCSASSWFENPAGPCPGEECLSCGMYIYDDCDDASSSATSDDGANELAHDDTMQRYLAYGDQKAAAEELWQAYVFARRRWRSFTGKFSRSFRRPFRKGSGRKGKGKRIGKSKSGKGLGFGLPHYQYSSDPFPRDFL